MARNILFIILFIVLYGGLFLFCTKNGEEMIDRGGFGEFSENHYSCEACNFEMELESDWIPLDGTAIRHGYTKEELYDYFGEPGTYDIITGFYAPGFYVECVRYNDVNMDNGSFTSTFLDDQIEYCKEGVRQAGGIMGSSGSYIFQAQGNGQNMGIYNYDYTLDDEFFSELNCFMNCGDDVLWFYGYYENRECMGKILTFLNSKISFSSSAEQII